MDLHITGWDEEHGVSNVTFENLTICGEPAEPEVFHNLNVSNLTFMQNNAVTNQIHHFVSPGTVFKPLDICKVCNRSRFVEEA